MDSTTDKTGTITLLTSDKDEQMVRVSSEIFDIDRIVIKAKDDKVLLDALLEFKILAQEFGTFEHVMDKTPYDKYNVVKAFAFAKDEESKKQQFSVHYVVAFGTADNKMMTDQMEVANYIDQTG